MKIVEAAPAGATKVAEYDKLNDGKPWEYYNSDYICEASTPRYQYTLYYNKNYVFNNVPDVIKDQWRPGATVAGTVQGQPVTATIKSVLSRISSSRKVMTTSGYKTETDWQIVANISCSYTTGWLYNNGVQPNYTFQNKYGSSISPSSVTTTKSVHWTVYKKASSGSSSSSSNSQIVNDMAQNVQNTYTKPTSTNPGTSSGNYNTGSNSATKPNEVSTPDVTVTEDSKKLYIRSLYKTVLQKEPSNEEISGHISKSLRKLTYDIVLSQKSQELNNINNISNQDFVKKLYKAILCRDADAGGLSSHVSLLNNGYSKFYVISGLTSSSEFKSQRGTDRKTKTITLNENLCNAVYNSIITKTPGIDVVRPSSTTLLMYEDQINNITELDISGKDVSDLSGLSAFSNLQMLYANNNQITNFSELSKLTKLTILNVNNTGIRLNIGYVFNLTNLERLYLDGNNLENNDLSGKLNKLTKLSTLSIADNKITSIDGITNNLSSIKRLFIRGNRIDNINVLNSVALTDFEAYNNSIVKISTETSVSLPQIFIDATNSSSKVYSSEGFECVNCRVENQKLVHTNSEKEATIKIKSGNAKGTTFKHSNSKTDLVFNDAVLADRAYTALAEGAISTRNENGKYYISVSEDTRNSVATLDLSASKLDNRKITDLSGIEQFPNLVSLNLNNNQVSNLNKLSSLKKLQTLTLRYNNLENLNGLSNVKSLKQLDVFGNYLTNIVGISYLSNLESLILENNAIGNNLQPLSGLTKLQFLNISNNQITDLSSLRPLSLTELRADKNGISDISMINKSKLTYISLKDNVAKISFTYDDDYVPMPSILSEAIKQNGLSCLDINYGSLENNRIVLHRNKCNAKITVKEGNFKGTIVSLENPYWTTAPQITVRAPQYNADHSAATITIESDSPLSVASSKPFTKVGDSESPYIYSATFSYNIENWTLVFESNGGKTAKTINLSGVENPKIPGLKVSYSTPNLTTGNVTVTVSTTSTDSNRLFLLPQQVRGGWQVSSDGKSVSRVYTDIDDSYLGGLGLLMFENEYDSSVNYNDVDLPIWSTNNVKVRVTNIDKTAPNCRVSYETEPDEIVTSMIVTLKADEKFTVQNTSGKVISSAWVEDFPSSSYEVSIYYANNVSETITVKDSLQNSATKDISITNIDNGVDGFGTKASSVKYTNKNSVLTLFAYEAIKLLGDDEPSVQPVSYSLRPVALGDGEQVPYEIPVNLTRNEYGVIAVNDNNNNTDITVYDSSFIDKELPYVVNETQTDNADGTKLVTLQLSEPINLTEDLLDWTLSEDGKTLTRVFNSDKNEKISLVDLAGNTAEYDLTVTNVQAIQYTYEVVPVEGTDKGILIIRADRAIKAVDGWTMLEDGKSMAKAVTMSTIEESLYISDEDGNSSKVYIRVYYGTEKAASSEEAPNDPNGEQKQPSNYDKNLPNGGEYALILELAIITLVSVSVVILRKYIKTQI